MLGSVLFLAYGAASAQVTDGPKPGAMRLVGQSCQDEAARFCSWADPQTTSPEPISDRDAYICLRVYKTSLSPGCRRAINGVTR